MYGKVGQKMLAAGIMTNTQVAKQRVKRNLDRARVNHPSDREHKRVEKT